ncbi:MAG: NMD3-related protein [Candidatus Kariarchaeaceae archaeon]
MTYKGIFCAVCGAQDVEVQDGFCSNCYGKEQALGVKIPERIKIFYCRECLSVQSSMGWTSAADFDEFIWLIKVAAQEFQKLPEDFRLEIQEEQFHKTQETVEIISSITYPIQVQLVRGYESDYGYYSKEEEVQFRLQKTMCKNCLIRKTSAFSSSIQVRADSRSITNEEIEFVDNKVNEYFGNLPKISTSFVVERTEKENGVDYLLSQKNDADMIVKEIRKYTGGKIKRSKSLVGQERDGKKIFRLTILLRLPEIQIGDIIIYEGHIYTVIFFQQGFWRFRNLKNGEIVRITEKERLERKVQSVLDKIRTSKFMLVSKDQDQAQIMNLEYYITHDIPANHIPEEIKTGEELLGFVWEEQTYLLSNEEAEYTTNLRRERELEKAAKK